MTRGRYKRVMREALKLRIRAEREAIAALEQKKGFRFPQRLEERSAIDKLSAVPTIFAFAEQIDSSFVRPSWADARYGAR